MKEALSLLSFSFTQLKRANKFRGLSGELIRKATAHFIQKCAMARLPFHDDPIIGEFFLYLL